MIWLLLLVLPFLYWLLKLFVLYLQIGTQEIFWKKWNSILATDSHLVYVALGDSTAQGIGGGKPANSYPILIRKWLEAQTQRPVQLINLSKSGAKVADCIEDQLPRIKDFRKAKIVTIEIGANDVRSFKPEQFEAEFKTLLKQLPKGTYVSDLPCFTGRAKNLDPRVVDMNVIIKKLLKNSGHYYVNLYQITRDNTGFGYFAADYFHPSARAYKNWAKAFTNAMKTRFSA